MYQSALFVVLDPKAELQNYLWYDPLCVDFFPIEYVRTFILESINAVRTVERHKAKSSGPG